MVKYLSRITFFVLIITLVIVGGCSAFGSKRQSCTEGNACVYFAGTEGIRMQQERPPTTLYYHSEDVTNPEGNAVEFNTYLQNEGPSYAYGATFIEGFDPNLFRVFNYKNGQWLPVAIPRAGGGSCYFDLLGFGTNGLGLAGGCNGVSGYTSSPGGNWGVNLNLAQIGLNFFGEKNWPDINLNFDRQSGGQFNIGVGYNGNILNALGYGRFLMGLVTQIDFESIGGSAFALQGDNPDYPGGESELKSFKIQMWQPWPAGQDFVRVPYQIKSCYAYTTFISPMICVDPNPFSNEKKICYAENKNWGGSQGAPVAVTRLEQTNTGKEVLLEFTIKNVGRGQVWDVGHLASCSPYAEGRVSSVMHDVVYIGPAYIGNTRVDCSKQGSVRLDPNTKEGRFTCRYDFSQGAANIGSGYETPLKMELWYGYEEVISNTLTIRKLG